LFLVHCYFYFYYF